MRGDIYGSLGSVTKGEPGMSAYEIAVKHGFVGTEEEWLATLKADAEPAQEAAESAETSAKRAESARDAAGASAESAKGYQRAAETNEQVSYDNRVAAAASAREATTAASSAAENAAYIAGRVNAAMISADQAAASESHAEASAGRAWQSEANAKQSELMAAEWYTRVRDASGTAVTAAEAAAGSATAAANSATQAATTIANFNANVEQAHTYASVAGSYANSAQNYATSAAASADRAEAALGNALQPLSNYYNKQETDSIVGGAVTSLSGAMVSLESSLTQQISAIPKYKTIPVASLPSTDIDTEAIYLVVTGDESQNLYTEYIYVNDAWEKLGTQTLDLSGYETTSDIAPYKAKLDSIEAGAQVNTVTGVKGSDELIFRTGDISISKADIGLGNVDNTADSVKSVAAATVASCLDNVDLSVNYAQGDVVFVDDLNPSSCLVCVSVPGGSTP